jgi:hypothetical protein
MISLNAALIDDTNESEVPPYGQDDVPGLKSVFEVEHLRRNDVFLDTQCVCRIFPLAYNHAHTI